MESENRDWIRTSLFFHYHLYMRHLSSHFINDCVGSASMYTVVVSIYLHLIHGFVNAY